MYDIKELLTLTQEQLHKYIRTFNPKTHKKITYPSYTIFIPKNTDVYPLFTCHMDTVSRLPPLPEDIIEKDGILSLSKKSRATCLGGDDRCGVWIALNLMKHLPDAAFGFFEDEETGCEGSSDFINSKLETFYDQIQAVIGLDRRTASGVPEIASYGLDNDELLEMLPPYTLTNGTFSDNLIIAEYICAATYNIGVGYDHEHTKREVIYLKTLERVFADLKEFYLPSEFFEPDYQPVVSTCHLSQKTNNKVCCDLCGEHEPLYEEQMMYVCEDCLESIVDTDYEETIELYN